MRLRSRSLGVQGVEESAVAARHLATVQAAGILVAAVTAGILVATATTGSRSSGILVVIRRHSARYRLLDRIHGRLILLQPRDLDVRQHEF